MIALFQLQFHHFINTKFNFRIRKEGTKSFDLAQMFLWHAVFQAHLVMALRAGKRIYFR